LGWLPELRLNTAVARACRFSGDRLRPPDQVAGPSPDFEAVFADALPGHLVLMTETIQIQSGKIRGNEIADGALGWRGIPYAAEPVESLRWQLPQHPASWRGVRNAAEYRAPSLQAPGMPGADTLLGGASPEPLPDPSEDCLYLDVTTPAHARPSSKWRGISCKASSTAAGRGAPFLPNSPDIPPRSSSASQVWLPGRGRRSRRPAG
jgi:hypothetical protein